MTDRFLIIFLSIALSYISVSLIGGTHLLSNLFENSDIKKIIYISLYLFSFLIALFFYFFTKRPYSYKIKIIGWLIVLVFLFHILGIL